MQERFNGYLFYISVVVYVFVLGVVGVVTHQYTPFSWTLINVSIVASIKVSSYLREFRTDAGKVWWYMPIISRGLSVLVPLSTIAWLVGASPYLRRLVGNHPIPFNDHALYLVWILVGGPTILAAVHGIHLGRLHLRQQREAREEQARRDWDPDTGPLAGRHWMD